MDFLHSTSSRLIRTETLSRLRLLESITAETHPEEYWSELEPILNMIYSEREFASAEQLRFEQGKSEMTADDIKRLVEMSVNDFREDLFTDDLTALYQKAIDENERGFESRMRKELLTRYQEIEDEVNRLAVESRLKHDKVSMRALKSQLEIYKPGFWILAILCVFAFLDLVFNHL